MTKGNYPYWYVSPHTFILGAGASCASFPNGDKYGKEIPLMNNFIDVLGLDIFFEQNQVEISSRNIEAIYSELVEEKNNVGLVKELNNKIRHYFSSLVIPDEVTLYDELILSLQAKDAIFTFNWDPLLSQAYSRNLCVKELPKIHFLHGNVSIGICEKDKHSGYLGNSCSKCGQPFSPINLLYPVKNKDYTSDPFIKSEWDSLDRCVKESFYITIFGYSAPKTDVEAVSLLETAWRRNSRYEFNEVNIVDILPRANVENNWSGFIYKSHGGIYDNVRDTQSFRYARRSCESWGDAIMQGEAWHENNIPQFRHLQELQSWVKQLVEEEILSKQTNVLLRGKCHI